MPQQEFRHSAAVFAEDAAIQSANIVGYTTQTCQPNTWYLIGAQFEGTDGKAIDLQKFIQSDDLVPGLNYVDPNAPSLKIWRKKDGDMQYIPFLYARQDSLDEPLPGGKAWIDATGGDFADGVTINPGEGAWIKTFAGDPYTITVAGQVIQGGQKEFTLVNNAWNLLANPFPIRLALNGPKFDCSALIPGVNYVDSSAPSLKVWKLKDGDMQYVPYLYARQDSLDDPLPGGKAWIDATGGDYTEDTVDVGGAFWIKYTNSTEDKKVYFTE